jgi:hypothetical protein
MSFWIWMAGSLIAFGFLGLAAADQADNVAAITPGSPGVLTKCRNWVVTSSCRTYHHIDLPARIVVGETFMVSFGSHPKKYEFPVARIALTGQGCEIFSKAGGDGHQMDKIDVARCDRADEGR